jgi:hypothetical protein
MLCSILSTASAVVLAVSLPFFSVTTPLTAQVQAQAQAQSHRVHCSEVLRVEPLLEGKLAGVTCPEATFVVSVAADANLPAVGPARTALRARQGNVTVFLIDATERRFPVVQP